MRAVLLWALVGTTLPLPSSCALFAPEFADLPVATRLSFSNFSTRYYAVLGLRVHVDAGAPGAFVLTPLMPPGAAYRVDFTEFLGAGCPIALDCRLFLYKRVNDDQDPPIPIGLDETEQVETTPIVAGQIDNVPGPCSVSPSLGVYTIVNWETDEGFARVKFAQGSEVDGLLRDSGRFPNADAAWEIAGVDPAPASELPPPPAATDRIVGRVTLTDGTGVEGVGVLLRTRFRVRLDDADPANDPDAGYGDPIDFTTTDASGAFVFDRPAGVYQVEFFSDAYAFGPAAVEVETPLETIWVLAEPL